MRRRRTKMKKAHSRRVSEKIISGSYYRERRVLLSLYRSFMGRVALFSTMTEWNYSVAIFSSRERLSALARSISIVSTIKDQGPSTETTSQSNVHQRRRHDAAAIAAPVVVGRHHSGEEGQSRAGRESRGNRRVENSSLQPVIPEYARINGHITHAQ